MKVFCFLQDDVVMGTLTVRENLRFSAALRLPKSIRQREKDEKIERLIQELGLSKVADSRVTNQTHLHLTDNTDFCWCLMTWLIIILP